MAIKIYPPLANQIYLPLAYAWYSKGRELEALGNGIEANAAFTKAKELGYAG
jgi:hypothetical protein